MSTRQPQQLAASRSDILPIREDEAALEAIARFDELEEERLAELVSNPAARQILNRLREVDRWLESAVEANQVGDSSVTADDLYRFGRGRGAEPLSDLRQKEVEAYLDEHPEEARWTAALSDPIPVPLEVSEPVTRRWPASPAPSQADTAQADTEQADTEQADTARTDTAPGTAEHTAGAARPSIRPVEDLGGARGEPRVPASLSRSKPRTAAWMRWAPAAAAALVLGMVLGPKGSVLAAEGALPESPILRSASSTPLLFPRGRVLAPVDGLETFAARPLFEVSAVEGADRYRFELRRNDGGAFDQGEVVWAAESSSRNATADRLSAGTFEWSAWATVDGVERSLGSLSFAVLPPEQAWLLESAAGTDARTASDDVRFLHAAGFLTDARRRARDLAPGEARAAYLAEQR